MAMEVRDAHTEALTLAGELLLETACSNKNGACLSEVIHWPQSTEPVFAFVARSTVPSGAQVDRSCCREVLDAKAKAPKRAKPSHETIAQFQRLL